MTRERKDQFIGFTTTESQFRTLQELALTHDSLSSLLREIIQWYIDSQPVQEKPHDNAA